MNCTQITSSINSIEIQLKSCLEALCSNHINNNSLVLIFDVFKKVTQSTQQIVEHRKDYAVIFCELLRCCKLVYKSDDHDIIVPERVQKDLLIIFNNIKRLYIEANDELHNGYVKVMWFLNELNSKATQNKASAINYKSLKSNVENLLDILDEIQVIFDFKSKNEYIFPINKLITAVIKEKHKFLNSKSITKEEIKILRLAVRLFKDNKEKNVISYLKDKFNLKFINYLTDGCLVIDTEDFKNYQENGVIIFYNPRNRNVLIRSDCEDYFKDHIDDSYEYGAELNYKDQEIGWFIEYELKSEEEILSYKDILKDKEKRISFLELLFDKHCYNIFLDNSIVLKNGELKPINPCCEFDKKIITCGEIKTKIIKSIGEPENSINEILKDYWIVPVLDNGVVNKLNFGLCILLLSINNTGLAALNLDSMTDKECFQNQLIDNWIKSNSTTLDHVKILLNIWYDELRYLDNDLLNVRIKPIRFLPFYYPLKNLYKKAGINLLKDESVILGSVIKDNSCFYVLFNNFDKRNYSLLNRELDPDLNGKVPVDRFKVCSNSDDLSEFEGKDFYCCYSFSKQKGHLCSSSFLKSVYSINTIQGRLLKYSLCNSINSLQYSLLLKYMHMYTDAFSQIASAHKLGSDIDSQCCIRFLHCLIWSKFTKKSQLNCFFEIINYHQLADFRGIINNKFFKRNNQNTLYIPKDSFEQSSVLSDIYLNEFRPVNIRDVKPLYNTTLTMKNGFYCVNGCPITEIVLLTDNFTDGASTIDVLSAHLGIEPEDKNKMWKMKLIRNRIQHYYCDNKPVCIKDVLERNSASLKVRAYYGTQKGMDEISLFLKKIQGKCSSIDNEPSISSAFVFFEIPLDIVADKKILKKAKKLWSNSSLNILEGQPLFIRKYSMPKSYILPKALLGKGENFINIFILREELQISEI